MSNFSELRQFGIMKDGCIIPVIGILAFRNEKSRKNPKSQIHFICTSD